MLSKYSFYFFKTKGDYKINLSLSVELSNSSSLNNETSSNFTTKSVRKQSDEITDCSIYPSCKNLKDGRYPLNDCKSYFQCKDERTLGISNCPNSASSTSESNRRRNNRKSKTNLRFNFVTQRCDLIDNVSYECGGYAIPVDIYSKKIIFGICVFRKILHLNLV